MSAEHLSQIEEPPKSSPYRDLPVIPKGTLALGLESPVIINRHRIINNDQEIFIDSSSPLILVNDSNMQTPLPLDLRTQRLSRVKARSSHSESQGLTRKSSKLHQSQDHSLVSEGEEEQSELTVGLGATNLSKRHRNSIFSSAGKPATDQEEEQETDIFENQEKIKKPKTNKLQKQLKALLKSNAFSIIVTIFTIYALFGDNFRIMIFTKSADIYFDVLTLITLAAFTFEILVTLYAKKDYKWSFFFWLDILSTVSLILDVNFISADVFPDAATQTVQLARASRASRIGTKAGRVVRIVRLVRLAKLYKEIKKKQTTETIREQFSMKVHPIASPLDKSQDINSSFAKDSPLMKNSKKINRNILKEINSQSSPRKSFLLKHSQRQAGQQEKLRESRVGKKLSDLTTKRVIIIVLALLLLIPLFSADFFFNAPTSGTYEMALLETLFNSTEISTTTQDAALSTFIGQQTSANSALAYMANETSLLFSDSTVDITTLRDNEAEIIQIYTSSKGNITCYLSTRSQAIISAVLDLLRTIFICIVLTFGALLFSKDANDLILRPIERMIEKVKTLTKNPLLAKEQGIVKDPNAGFENETVQIENAIIKIGGLLALGFGDAGSLIIARNLANSGDLNPMLAGKKRIAIYGFCDIRNFTDATEVLQEDVMVFVNSIADIVHSMVDKYTGAANKNIGDAFLLVWKFPGHFLFEDDYGNLDLENTLEVQNMADFALISFLKINARINRDPTLLEFSRHPGLNARLPNYKVKMGFGLHVGWAIEGAIGSEFKIDASYLSPNVNMASRLEAATKQYGVPLLFSGELYKYLSLELKRYSRMIDVVTVKGSVEPIELYTVDMDVNDFNPSKDRTLIADQITEQRHFEKKELIRSIMSQSTSATLIENDKELQHMFRNKNPEFYKTFKIGFTAYIQGDWTTAKKRLIECLEMQNNDGPTRNLLAYMEAFDFISPEEWTGYHVLTEK